MGKKVLITGATGFIGNHVTRLCLEKGDTVRVMVMPHPGLPCPLVVPLPEGATVPNGMLHEEERSALSEGG